MESTGLLWIPVRVSLRGPTEFYKISVEFHRRKLILILGSWLRTV